MPQTAAIEPFAQEAVSLRHRSLRLFVLAVAVCVMLVAALDIYGWARHILYFISIRPGFAT